MEELIESRTGEFYSVYLNNREFIYVWYDSNKVTRAKDMVVTSKLIEDGWYAVYMEGYANYNVEVYARA